MPGLPSVAAKLKTKTSGPFVPTARINNSAGYVKDMRTPTPMDYVAFEDGTKSFVTDPNVGARLPSAGQRKWMPLPGGSLKVERPPIPSGGGRGR